MLTKEEISEISSSSVKRSKAAERRLANLFKTWTGVEFRRRRVEGRDSNTIERESTADVIAVNKVCKFSIECKIEKGFSFDALLRDPRTCKFTKWLHQATWDATLMSRTFNKTFYPLVFFKPHPNHDFVVVPSEVFTNNVVDYVSSIPYLEYTGYRWCGPITLNISHSKKNPVMKELALPAVWFMRWQDFVANVKPASIFYHAIA